MRLYPFDIFISLQTIALLLWWGLGCLLAFWALRIAQRFGMRMPRTAKQPVFVYGDRLPRVAVILPIKGVEEDTHLNIRALREQDYPEYRLIFAVESEEDPIVPVLEKAAIDDSRIEIVVAGLATARGQKVHNQLAAVSRTSEQDEALVFIDADARPDPLWLQYLAAPLTRPDIGATTGYRYYVPVTPHMANKVVSVLNGMVAGLLGPYRRTFAWGGSMAVRRTDFYGARVKKGQSLHDLWQRALSDDYVLSYYIKGVMKSKIHFVPNCLVASEANFNWPSLFEFAARQYRITKVCAPWVWLTAIGGSILFLSAFVSSLAVAITGLFRPFDWLTVAAFVAFIGLYGQNVLRGMLILRGGTKLLPAHENAIRSCMTVATAGMPFCYVISLLALAGSAIGRTIVWRGITYQMTSHIETQVRRPEVAGAATRVSRTADHPR